MASTLTPAPFWSTPIGTIASTAENATFAFTLAATVTAAGAVIGSTIAVGSAAVAVTGARIDGVTTAFSFSGQSVIVAGGSATPYYLDLQTTLTPAFTLLNGFLPLGLTLSADGQIAGVVGNVEPLETGSTRDYRFTIRARHEQQVRDRTFAIVASWTDSAPAFSEALFTAYQDFTLTSGSVVAAYLVGPVSQGRALSVAFDASDADGPPPAASLLPRDAGAPLMTGTRLPNELSWNAPARRIEGVVDVATPIGTYLYDLVIEGAAQPLSIALVIAPRDADAEIEPVLVVSWITPAGSLGTLRDGDIAALSVRAATSTGAPVAYEIIGAERDALAARGLRLDPVTGEFHGRLNATATESLSFIVRASAGLAFDDRAFSISVTSRYAGSAISVVGMDLTDRGTAMLAEYDIPSDLVFRPRDTGEDMDHGIMPRAEMYLVGGLSGGPDAVRAAMTDGAAGLPRSDYHGVRDLILGPHALYVARLGNRILHEVLVRTLSDPHEAAGGFADDGTEVPIPNPVRPELGFVRPQSVRNARFDLIKGVGLAASGADAELLPLWMRSRQRGNAPAPGFVMALPIAFLVPNAGTGVLAAARAIETGTAYPNGMVVRFTNYRVETMDRTTSVRTARLLGLPSR